MPRAKPKAERTCLVCDAVFMGTPAATRCDPCKAAGLSVPRDRQAARRKAAPMPYRRKCLECGTTVRTASPNLINCEPCAALYAVEIDEMTPEQAERAEAEKHRQRHRDRLEMHRKWLDARSQKPRGYKTMTATNAKTPLGQLWVRLCTSDGAASALLFADAAEPITDADKVALLTSYLKLRLRRCHPDAIANLCPVALLRAETQAALEELPEVTESVPEEEPAFDPYEGLTTDQKADLIAFTERQKRHRDAVALGLA